MAKKKWLVVEPALYIHSVGYLQCILQNDEWRTEYDLIFVYAEGGSPDRDILSEVLEKQGDGFRCIKIEHQPNAILGKIPFQLGRTWTVLRNVERIASQEKVDSISFLGIDQVMRLVAIPGMQRFFGAIRGRAMGVFFNTRCFRETGIGMRGLAFAVSRAAASGFVKKLLFLDHGVCKIFSDRLGSEHANLVGPAVDPWSRVEDDEETDSGESDERTTLLTFGAHSTRKGTIFLLRMFRDFPEELSGFRLVVAGPVRDCIREEFDRLMDEVEGVECIDRFISDNDSWRYFHQADIMVCPYVDFHGSSNVIIRSAAVGLPVVAPAFGFLKEVVEGHGIGVTYQNQDPREILDAILALETQRNSRGSELRSACAKYADLHAASRYAPSLLEPFGNSSETT